MKHQQVAQTYNYVIYYLLRSEKNNDKKKLTLNIQTGKHFC